MPTVWFGSHAYRHEAQRLESLVDIQAYLVTQLINRNPAFWQFEVHRIDEILARTYSYEHPVSFQVLDSDGAVAAAHVSNGLDDLAGPLLRRSVPLFDSGNVVGRIEIASSLRPAFIQFGLIGLVSTMVAVVIFITLRILPLRALTRAWQNVTYLASHDQLTDLPNRTLFRDRLQQALAQAERHHQRVAAICLDLDHFKDVNDTLGHAVGDELLQQVSRRIQGLLRKSDTLARLGGDEFAIIQAGVEHPDQAGQLARRVIDVLSEAFQLSGHEVVVGGSIGIALYPDDHSDPDHLLRSADLALYRAKAEGRGVYCFFEESMNARLQERRALETDLRKAMKEQQFELYYQPQIDLDGKEMTGVEALIRWHHPERGMVGPVDFIPIAEETGLITPLTEWVLRQACSTCRDWEGINVAVNLSPAVFKHQDLLGMISGILRETDFDPHRLELEVTETSLLQDTERALAILNDLKSMGIRIGMDDFGTGYSSLSYLQRFPFDKIKIDRSFVAELTANEDATAIVRAVINLGQSLGMATTAEGVETNDQALFLTGQGCDEVQGYFYARPMPAQEIALMVEAIPSPFGRPRVHEVETRKVS